MTLLQIDIKHQTTMNFLLNGKKPCAYIGFVSAGLLVTELSLLAASHAQSTWTQLTGRNLEKAISGHHFYDDTHYDVFYERAGTLSGTTMGASIQMKWKIKQNKVCQLDGQQEDCFTLYTDGHAYKFKHELYDIELYGLLK